MVLEWPELTNAVREYLVLWTGYSIDDALWIPVTNFHYPEVFRGDGTLGSACGGPLVSLRFGVKN